MTKPVITEQSRVTFHFSLALENGDVVDSTFEKVPATFEFGDGNLPEGFSRLLIGLAEGEQKTFVVSPESAFGQPNPNNIQVIPLDKFPAYMTLEEGLMVSFSDAGKAELPGVIKAVEDGKVHVDFNHPLAGRDLTFVVEIVSVEEAQASSEMESGGRS